MDVEARGNGALTLLHIDATVRNPLAASHLRGGTGSAAVDGACLIAAAKDKQARYPPKGGLRVLTAGIETFGRTSSDFDELLRALAAAADAHAASRGMPAVSWLRKWQTELSCGLARAVANSLSDAYNTAVPTHRLAAAAPNVTRTAPTEPATTATTGPQPTPQPLGAPASPTPERTRLPG